MRVLKWIGIVLLVLIVVLLVVSFFLPSKISIKKDVTINAPVETVFTQVNSFKNWKNWDAWNESDPEMVNSFDGPESGTGAIWSWTSEKEGNGKMEIIESAENEMLKMGIGFEPDPDNMNYNEWIFAETEEGTKVNWSFDFDLGWNPVPKFYFALAGEKMLNEYFERSLNNLKEHVESLPVEPSVAVEETTIEDRRYLVITDWIASSDMHSFFEMAYGKLMDYMDESEIEAVGPPVAIYHSWSEKMDTFEVSAGMHIPYEIEVEGDDDIKLHEVEAGNILSAMHSGSYETVGETYTAVEEYVKENNKEIRGSVFEVYLTDPNMEPDTSKWMTQIVYPVK